MAGHSQYYRENASITSSLMNSQEAGIRAGDGISFQPQPPMSPYESSNYPHFNQRTRTPVQTTPRWDHGKHLYLHSMDPEQDHSVHSKLDKMMNMLSSTHDLVIRPHKALEEKVHSKKCGVFSTPNCLHTYSVSAYYMHKGVLRTPCNGVQDAWCVLHTPSSIEYNLH